MRSLLVLASLLAVVVPVLLAETAVPAYTTQFTPGLNGEPFVQLSEQTVQGKIERLVTVRFQVQRTVGITPEPGDRIEIQEDGVTVARLDLSQPQVQPMNAVLCLDISGSMATAQRLDQARNASLGFVDRLPPTVDLGLLLFDDQVRERDPLRCVPLAGDSARFVANRGRIRERIQAAQPEGGTAYLDATERALQMLGPGSKQIRKAVIVMTDGADLASKTTLDAVIRTALRSGIPVYTIGIGQPGRGETVNTVLVLDRSGSMKGKASDSDAKTKLEALQDAACRFLDLTRTGARTTLLPFSTTVSTARAPTNDRESLKRRIREITADGGTRLYDAIAEGIDTVAATAQTGKRVVVVLTDGRDEAPGSRANPTEIVRRAKEENVTLFTLGLGREHEVNHTILKQVADDTGGQFFPIGNQKRLMEVFEKLSLEIHDEGIDEASLQKLAQSTGGRYYHVADAAQLQLEFPRLAAELQQTHTVTFPSRRQLHDGTARGITLSVVRGTNSQTPGERVSNVAEASYSVRGLIVVPEVGPVIFLVLLVLLLGLLGLPALLPRRPGSEG